MLKSRNLEVLVVIDFPSVGPESALAENLVAPRDVAFPDLRVHHLSKEESETGPGLIRVHELSLIIPHDQKNRNPRHQLEPQIR